MAGDNAPAGVKALAASSRQHLKLGAPPRKRRVNLFSMTHRLLAYILNACEMSAPVWGGMAHLVAYRRGGAKDVLVVAVA